MRRKGNIFNELISFDNLSLAAYKAFKGKSSIDVFLFREDFIKNIQELRLSLIVGDFEIGCYRKFIIYEPKKRLICAAPLKQRILHHAIMNICHDRFNSNLIFDSYASRPGKGTHKAILRVKSKCAKFKYFAKLDVRKFFDSIDHDILKTMLRRIIKDNKILIILDKIIDSHGINKGLPIGNLTSQYFANYYLSSADHYMKENEKAPVYVRYMDDVILMSNDKAELKKLVRSYTQYLFVHLKLELKPPLLGNSFNGIPFLGYVVFKDRILMNGKGKRRYKRNICLLNSLFDKEKISEKEYSDRLLSTLAYAKFADSFSFRLNYLG